MFNEQTLEISSQPNEPIQPGQQEQASGLPKKKFKLPLVVILVIVILLIAAGVSYAIKNFNKPKACTLEAKICPDGSSVGRTGPNCEFAPCPSGAVTPVTDEISGWQTYTNKEFNFEFKYPPTGEVKPKGGQALLALGVDGCTVSVLSLAELTLRDWLISNKILPLDNNMSTHIQESDLTVGGLTAKKITTPVNGGNETVYVARDNYVYSLNCSIPEGSSSQDDFEKNRVKFSQILSTFKFLD